MKSNNIYFLVIFPLLIFPFWKVLNGQNKITEIDNLLSEYTTKKEFSGAVLVARQGTVLFKKGYGHADFEQGVLNTPQTKFSIGSTTKSFTACAIMQEEEKGNLGLHTPISSYIPELKADLGKLTLHQLMKNSSGLPVHLNRLTELNYRDISSKEIIEIYNAKATLSFKPGTSYGYSNLNYQLAAIVLERVTGKAYKDYLQATVFDAFGMNNSGVERTFDFPKDKAKGYVVESGMLKLARRNFMAYAKGGGDLYASTVDLLKWDQALYQEEYINNKSKEKLFDGNPTQFGGYGYGFKIKPYQRSAKSKELGTLARHGGSMFGYQSNVHRYLDDQVTIIILGNIRPFPIMEITVAIEKIILGT